MTAHVAGLLCVVLAVLLEATAQLFLKRGTEHPAGTRPLVLMKHAWRNAWIVAAVAAFLSEAALWTLALYLLPVSIAVPAGSLCFVFVALLSKLFLHEQVGFAHWVGIGLILAGVAVIGAS